MNFLKHSIIVIFLMFITDLNSSENFTIAPKKRPVKLTASDCCQHILEELKGFARISQYIGIIQGIELTWVENYMNEKKNTFFNRATQEQLVRYNNHKQKVNAAREEYEAVLRENRDFLKQLEQEVLAPVSKK